MCRVYAYAQAGDRGCGAGDKKGSENSTFIQGIESEACTLASPRQAFS
jgi:hypothetical protein